MIRRSLVATILVCSFAFPSLAAEYEVKMLNKGEKGTMVFEPDFIRAEPGDVIRFTAATKGHNVEAIKEMIPEGAEVFKGKINEELEVTLTETGIYGIKCTPHFAMGMVMAIQVGEAPEDLDTQMQTLKEVKLPKKARERMDDALSQVN